MAVVPFVFSFAWQYLWSIDGVVQADSSTKVIINIDKGFIRPVVIPLDIVAVI